MEFFKRYLLPAVLLAGAIFGAYAGGLLRARDTFEFSKNPVKEVKDFYYHWGDLPLEKMSQWSSLPNAWHKYTTYEEINAEKNTDVMWLMITIADGVDLKNSALFLPSARYKVEVYVDYRKVYNFGDPSNPNERKFLGMPFHLVELPDSVSHPFIYVKIFSPFSEIGLDPPVFIGSASGILRDLVRATFPGVIMGAAPLLVGLILLLVFLRFFQRREILYLGMLFLAFAGFLFFRSPMRQILFPDFPILVFDVIHLCCLYALPACFLGFAEHLLKMPKSWIRWGAKWFFAFLGVTAGLLVIFDYHYPAQLNIAFQVGILGSVLAFFGSSHRLEQRTQDRYSLELTWGLAAVAGTAVIDILIQRGIIALPIYLSIYAFVAFLFILLRMLVRQLKEQTEEQLVLRNELETVGLLQTTILKDRKASHARYDMRIFFRPALYAAGDWYDHKLVNNRWLVLHVGDVTGHGAAAAMNASYAKGCITMHSQNEPTRKPDIAHLHNLLNQSLIDIGESKLTMSLVSVIIDIETGEFEYLNSGHVPPLIFSVDSKAFRPLLSVNPNILGIDPRFNSAATQQGQLRSDQMLVMQTDGVGDVYSYIAKDEFRIKGQTSLSKSISFFSKLSFRDPYTLCAGIESRLISAVNEDYHQDDDATVLAFKMKDSA